MYEKRIYREQMNISNYHKEQLLYRESDIVCLSELVIPKEIHEKLAEIWKSLEHYISKRPDFLTSFKPLAQDLNAPFFIQEMLYAASCCNVGPMACVAGAVNLFLGRYLLSQGIENFVLENGGDILLSGGEKRKIQVQAKGSPFHNKLFLLLEEPYSQLGICTSSATNGHSKSFGVADAVLVKSKNICIADAAATYLCNCTGENLSIESILEKGMAIPSVEGILILKEKKLGVIGDLKLGKRKEFFS